MQQTTRILAEPVVASTDMQTPTQSCFGLEPARTRRGWLVEWVRIHDSLRVLLNALKPSNRAVPPLPASSHLPRHIEWSKHIICLRFPASHRISCCSVDPYLHPARSFSLIGHNRAPGRALTLLPPRVPVPPAAVHKSFAGVRLTLTDRLAASPSLSPRPNSAFDHLGIGVFSSKYAQTFKNASTSFFRPMY